MANDLVFKDKAGKQLEPGDLIAYGHALGRCAALQYAKVLALQLSKKTEWNPHTKTLEYLVKVRVQGVDLSDNWDSEEDPTLLRISVLAFGSRMLKLSRDQVEPRVLALLDTVKVP